MKPEANKICHREKLVIILDAFKNHKSVQRTALANFPSKSILNFSKSTESEVNKEILDLPFKKTTRNSEIPAKGLKKNVDIYIKE